MAHQKVLPYRASAELLEFLRTTDTCSVSNAIETYNVRMRHEGFTQDAIQCQFPKLGPVAGYAVTGRIRTTAPPITDVCYYHRTDWWEYVASFPSPKIMVIRDVDRIPGTGAFVGEIHARIAQALGCVAYISNGTVRDLAALREAKFHCFSGGASVSHSYAHIVDFGEPIDMGGLTIAPGNLLHGDCHGVQMIPPSIAEDLPNAVRGVAKREAELIRFCRSSGFSLEKLVSILNRETPVCVPPDRH